MFGNNNQIGLFGNNNGGGLFGNNRNQGGFINNNRGGLFRNNNGGGIFGNNRNNNRANNANLKPDPSRPLTMLNLNQEFVTDIPASYVLNEEIKTFFSHIKTQNLDIFRRFTNYINAIGADFQHNYRDWHVLLDGSAYSGQMNSETEAKQGLGRHIDSLGNYCVGLFVDDIFVQGVIFAVRPFRIIMTQYQSKFIDEEHNTTEGNFTFYFDVKSTPLCGSAFFFNGQIKNMMPGSGTIQSRSQIFYGNRPDYDYFMGKTNVASYRGYFKEGKLDGDVDMYLTSNWRAPMKFTYFKCIFENGDFKKVTQFGNVASRMTNIRRTALLFPGSVNYQNVIGVNCKKTIFSFEDPYCTHVAWELMFRYSTSSFGLSGHRDNTRYYIPFSGAWSEGVGDSSKKPIVMDNTSDTLIKFPYHNRRLSIPMKVREQARLEKSGHPWATFRFMTFKKFNEIFYKKETSVKNTNDIFKDFFEEDIGVENFASVQFFGAFRRNLVFRERGFIKYRVGNLNTIFMEDNEFRVSLSSKRLDKTEALKVAEEEAKEEKQVGRSRRRRVHYKKRMETRKMKNEMKIEDIRGEIVFKQRGHQVFKGVVSIEELDDNYTIYFKPVEGKLYDRKGKVLLEIERNEKQEVKITQIDMLFSNGYRVRSSKPEEEEPAKDMIGEILDENNNGKRVYEGKILCGEWNEKSKTKAQIVLDQYEGVMDMQLVFTQKKTKQEKYDYFQGSLSSLAYYKKFSEGIFDRDSDFPPSLRKGRAVDRNDRTEEIYDVGDKGTYASGKMTGMNFEGDYISGRFYDVQNVSKAVNYYYYNPLKKPLYEFEFKDTVKVTKSEKKKKIYDFYDNEFTLLAKGRKLVRQYFGLTVDEKGYEVNNDQMEEEERKQAVGVRFMASHLNQLTFQIFKIIYPIVELEAYEESIVLKHDGAIHYSESTIYAHINEKGLKVFPEGNMILRISSDNFINGFLNFKQAKIEYKTGVYEGRVLFQMRHGNGKMTYKNGEEYNGGWKEDKRSGTGVMKWANGDSYEGGWLNGEFNGQGVLTFSNGSRMEFVSVCGRVVEEGAKLYDADGEEMEITGAVEEMGEGK